MSTSSRLSYVPVLDCEDDLELQVYGPSVRSWLEFLVPPWILLSLLVPTPLFFSVMAPSFSITRRSEFLPFLGAGGGSCWFPHGISSSYGHLSPIGVSLLFVIALMVVLLNVESLLLKDLTTVGAK